MKKIFLLAFFSVFSSFLSAAMLDLNNVSISEIAVNGGAGVPNSGVTCIRVSATVSTACANGLVAIPGNNSQLLSAALTAKSSGSKIWLYYSDSEPVLHCPGMAFTPCAVSSIMLK